MKKKTSSSKLPINKTGTKKIIFIALILALLSYLGYRSLLNTPEINVITEGSEGGFSKGISCILRGTCVKNTLIKTYTQESNTDRASKRGQGEQNSEDQSNKERQPNNDKNSRYDTR